MLAIEEIVKAQELIRDMGYIYTRLAQEIEQKQTEMEQIKNQIQSIATKYKFNTIESDNVMIERKTKEIKKFDSAKLKKENKDKYEQYRVPRKTFDAKKLKKEDLDLYMQYFVVTEIEEIIITKKLPTLDTL